MNGIKFATMTAAELAAKNELATQMISKIDGEATFFTGLTCKDVADFCFENANKAAEDSIILADIDDDRQTQTITVGEYAFEFQLAEVDADGDPAWEIVGYNGAEAVSIH